MSATLETTCPNCGKNLKVPAQFAGKMIRCKQCETTFEVPSPGAAKPATAKPATAKPATAKPAVPKAPDPNAPIKFQDDSPAPPTAGAHSADDDDDNPNPYGVTKDDSDVPRCPFCALELDPPDTKICLSCGYDLLERRRHGSKKVYDTTAGDYFKHWLPAIAWIVVILILISVSVLCALKMNDWLTGSFLDAEEKNDITGKTKFYLPPFCFNIWIWFFSAFIIFKGAKFAYRRLVINWRPQEVVKVT